MVLTDTEVAIREGIAQGLAKQANKTPELTKAFFEAWHQVGNVQKNAVNPHHKNNYANLEAVMAVVKPIMYSSGLMLVQVPGDIRDGNQSLLSTLTHALSGQSWHFRMEIPLGEKKTAQSTGSGTTYARRYFVMTLFGICPVDDDGEAASEPAPEPWVREAPPTTLIADMRAWKTKLKGKEAAAAFTDEFKGPASAGGTETAAAFIARRKEFLK